MAGVAEPSEFIDPTLIPKESVRIAAFDGENMWITNFGDSTVSKIAASTGKLKKIELLAAYLSQLSALDDRMLAAARDQPSLARAR